MLTVKDVADALKVHEMTIFRYLQKGKIKGIKIGNVWRISQDELQRIMREGL